MVTIKKFPIVCMHFAGASMLLTMACSNPVKNKIKGDWHSKDGVTQLKITEKEFSLEDGDAIPEDYFVKDDTIFTSFQGNEPLTSFVVEKLDDHYMKLMGPDSVAVEFNR